MRGPTEITHRICYPHIQTVFSAEDHGTGRIHRIRRIGDKIVTDERTVDIHLRAKIGGVEGNFDFFILKRGVEGERRAPPGYSPVIARDPDRITVRAPEMLLDRAGHRYGFALFEIELLPAA